MSREKGVLFLNDMNLDKQRIESLDTAGPPGGNDSTKEAGAGSTEGGVEGSIDISINVTPKRTDVDKAGINLFGSLTIEGTGDYFLLLQQRRSFNTWILMDTDIYDSRDKVENLQKVQAILKVKKTGRLEGYGKTFLLTRLMVTLSSATYMAINSPLTVHTDGIFKGAEFTSPDGEVYIKYTTAFSIGSFYRKLEMSHEGFRLNLGVANSRPLPFKLPDFLPVQDNKSKAAVVANLGVHTATDLFRWMGSRLDWYKEKEYKLIETDEQLHEVMLLFLRAVQSAHGRNKSVLIGLDTETTGLNMLDLEQDNPLRDSIVAIPFGWEDNKGYVICTDMYYFSNVSDDEIYPLLDKLFSRNPDYTFQDIELDYCGEHFSFNRMNITCAGWNVMFDEQAFFSHGAHVFFDEDGRQLFFNLDTDLLQGEEGQKEFPGARISNSLKAQTRRNIGDETLELDELFGPKHEDKYRYLQDTVLAVLYGGADADYNRKCVKIGRAMTEPQLYQQYRKYDMTLIYRSAEMAWRGMPVNTQAVRELGDKVNQDLDTLKEFIYHYAWLANRDRLLQSGDKLKELLGVDSDEDFVAELGDGKEIFRYEFTPENHKNLLFGMLGYPILKRAAKTGKPALDKFVLEKLINAPKKQNPIEILKENIPSAYDPDTPLINKEQFNTDSYPLARVFQTYATLNKEYTSYYKPIMQNDLEGRMFYGFTLAKAATRRILSPGQTLKGSLKALVVAPPGKIFMSFDASQIEYRHMASLAYIRTKCTLQVEHPDDWERRLSETAVARIHKMMQQEEADYHIETAAAMTGVRQHQVTSKVRKRYKSIGFGIPYGLGERAMCDRLHGGIVNDETMKETRNLLADYKKKQKEIIDLLESTRDSAFVPAPISDEHRKYLGVGKSHVGIVRNFVGFYRVFILEKLTRQRVGRIRRQAGNCIIQGGAAELFRRMLYNFQVGCVKAGLNGKIQWLMTVHDELDALVDSDIDIMALIKVLYENCTLRYKDHIPYYIGINFGSNWEEAKSDANELPVIMVQRMIAAYDAGRFSIPSDGNQASNLLLLKRHYMCDRIEEELKAILPALGPGFKWTEEAVSLVDDKFENYIVRAYMAVFAPENADLKCQLESWQVAREEYGFGVSFLTTKFSSVDDILDGDSDISFDAFDLSIDLLDNTSEEEESRRDAVTVTSWFGEDSLFDQNISSDALIVTEEDNDYTFGYLAREDDSLVENPNPTNAFDVFLTKNYVRTKVLKVNADTYSVLLQGTKYDGNVAGLIPLIKKQFSQGAGKIVLVGSSVKALSNLDCTTEDLDWLDKLLCEG